LLSYTPNYEDVLLRRCFRNVERGFYVDIGAHHPTNASVTRWFYDQGWSGINIEPGEGIEALRNERSRDVNLEIAVADFEGEATFWVHTGNAGTSTLSESVPDVVSMKAGEIQPRTVRVTTLPTILDKYANGQHIHFLKIDAEGAEEAIVRTSDWKRHRPEVVLIESTEPYTNTRRKEPWQDRLQESGYRMAYFDGVNDFWVREESSGLVDVFAVPVNVLDFFRSYDPEVASLRAMVAEQSSELASAKIRIATLVIENDALKSERPEPSGNQGGRKWLSRIWEAIRGS
jgi:FkbM family methyltransferase